MSWRILISWVVWGGPVLLGAALLGCRFDLSGDALSPEPLRAAEPLTSEDENWPGWRGANSAGVADAQPLPLNWSTSDRVQWRTPVPGRGNSSPVVWDDWILLTTATGERRNPELKLLCYHRDDGQLRWEATVGRGAGRSHSKNGHASATVCTDGARIYASFGGAGLVCYNFTGQKLWHVELGTLDHVWGAASSPLLCGDLVIQLCDQETNSFLVALDKLTGREIWRTPRNSYGNWSTPVLASATCDGQPCVELIVNGSGSDSPRGGRVTAYDPLTGEEKWYVEGTTDIVCPTPLVGDGLVFSTSGRNGPTLAIRPGGRGNVTATHLAWKQMHGAAYVPSGVLYRGRLYGLSDAGALICRDSKTGKLMWRERLSGAFSASLVAGDGRIYATNESGTTHVVAAADDFALLATNQLHEPTSATPAISRGALVFRTADHLLLVSDAPPPLEVVPEGDPEIGSPSDQFAQSPAPR